MTLRGVGVGAEKNQFCAVVADNNRVAGQLHINPAGKLDDVLTKYIRLRFTRRKENLVMAGFQRVQQRLAGKVERRPNLARFQNVTNAMLQSGAVPAELIFKRLREKNLFQLFDSLVAEKVLCRLFTFTFVAVGPP